MLEIRDHFTDYEKVILLFARGGDNRWVMVVILVSSIQLDVVCGCLSELSGFILNAVVEFLEKSFYIESELQY